MKEPTTEADIRKLEKRAKWLGRLILAVIILVCGAYATSRYLLLSANDLLGSHPGRVGEIHGAEGISMFFASRSVLEKCTGPIREMLAKADSVDVSCFTLSRLVSSSDDPGNINYYSSGRLHSISVSISADKREGVDGYSVLIMQSIGLGQCGDTTPITSRSCLPTIPFSSSWPCR